jgi:hypothetical protein
MCSALLLMCDLSYVELTILDCSLLMHRLVFCKDLRELPYRFPELLSRSFYNSVLQIPINSASPKCVHCFLTSLRLSVPVGVPPLCVSVPLLWKLFQAQTREITEFALLTPFSVWEITFLYYLLSDVYKQYM